METESEKELIPTYELSSKTSSADGQGAEMQGEMKKKVLKFQNNIIYLKEPVAKAKTG
jgi:hypothetical protein